MGEPRKGKIRLSEASAEVTAWLVLAVCGLGLLVHGACPLVTSHQGVQVDRLAAIRDPAYHRYLCFGAADAVLERELGRPLQTHERQSDLPWPQLQVIRRIEQAVRDRTGEVITVRFARQGGKNETEAQLEARLLTVFRGTPGSRWIRMAPTKDPQLVNSKARLDKFLASDPLLAGRWKKKEGGRVQVGHAEVQFLSAHRTARVVGASATLGLSLDEAHKIDAGKFEEDLAPFTASTNAPIVLWGVGADKQDLLFEYVDRNRGTDRLLEFPADVWCELSAAYAAHYAGRVAKLGAEHPWIMTQYRLLDVEALGAYLSDTQRRALFAGEHPRLSAPRDGMLYVLILDIGGESEVDLPDELVREQEPGRDSLVAWIGEWDPSAGVEPYPEVRVVDGHWWTGRDHMAVAPELIDLCRHWGISGGCIDARGVGEAVAGAVNRAYPCVQAYKATDATVSEDCYDLLARVNTGRVRFWRGDPAADEILREIQQQARHTRYEIARHDLMRITKPTGRGSSDAHIDGVKALTYLHRAMQMEDAAIFAHVAKKAQAVREGRA